MILRSNLLTAFLIMMGSIASISASENQDQTRPENATAPVSSPIQYEEESDYVATSVGSDFFTATKRGAGFIGGGEIVYLRPYSSVGMPLDFNFKPSYRAWVGYQNADGLGGRVRYWEYDQSQSDFGVETWSLDFHALDAELTQQVDYYSWNFLVSGGIRQAESRIAMESFGVPENGFGFSGVGLTFSAQATRDLNASGSFRFLAGGRWSCLFGNSDVEVDHVLSPYPLSNTTINIIEINMGPQFVRELKNGALLTIFGGAEAQSWNGGFGFGYLASDIGFVGFGTSISVLR